MAELRFQGLGRRPEAAGALGRLLRAELRQVGEGTPVRVVRAGHAARLPKHAAQIARGVKFWT